MPIIHLAEKAGLSDRRLTSITPQCGHRFFDWLMRLCKRLKTLSFTV